MGTHIFSGGNGTVSQVASAWTFDPAANVKLKKKGVPGTAWHKNSSGSLEIPLGTIEEPGTQVMFRPTVHDTFPVIFQPRFLKIRHSQNANQ